LKPTVAACEYSLVTAYAARSLSPALDMLTYRLASNLASHAIDPNQHANTT